jgi:hypothetical protein
MNDKPTNLKTKEQKAAEFYARIASYVGPSQFYCGRLCPDERVWPADIQAFYEARKARKLLPLSRWQLALERRLHGREWVMEQQRKAAEEAAAWEEALMEAAE